MVSTTIRQMNIPRAFRDECLGRIENHKLEVEIGRDAESAARPTGTSWVREGVGVMRTTLVLLTLLVAGMLATGLRAKDDKDVTLKGPILCTKCALKEKDIEK